MLHSPTSSAGMSQVNSKVYKFYLMSHKVRVNLPYMSSNKDSAFCQASNKWVTFNDMVDDAMEGGKLVARSDNSQHNLNRRRASMIDGDSGEF